LYGDDRRRSYRTCWTEIARALAATTAGEWVEDRP